MIDLYAAGTGNGLRAKIVLEECGLPYTLHKIDLSKGEHKQAQFLALNPMGLIPVIVDRDGPGGKPLTISQSIAIMLYAGEKSGRFIPQDPAERAIFFDALMNAATDIGPTLGAVFAISRSREPHLASQKIFEQRLRDYLSVWNRKLEQAPYCAGNEVTLADFALYAIVARCKQALPDLVSGISALDEWEQKIGTRPGVRKGMDFS